MSILCGTDFSEWSRAAVTAAAALAGRTGQELVLAHVLEPQVEQLDPHQTEKVRGMLRQRLDAMVAGLRSLTKGKIETVVLLGRSDEALREYAQQKKHSLIVVGSAGHGGAAMVRLSGSSERLAAGSAIPVLVARDGDAFAEWALGKPFRVLVGVDGSAAAMSAVRFVETLRKAAPVDVVVGRVYYPDEAHERYGLSRRFTYAEVDPEVEQLIERDLKRLVPSLEGSGEVFYRARLALGRVADHLLELAEAERCQMVVVGSHGRTGLARMWSVSSGALHLARMAVAVVPPDGKDTGPAATLPRVRRVLVTTDFSDFGNVAVPWAYALVEPEGEVYLAHVTLTGGLTDALLEAYVPGPQQSRAQVEAEVAARLRALTPASAARKGIVTRTEVVRAADAAKALCEAADRLGVDTLVIASHGRGGLARTVLGSVSEAVLRHAHKPVFIVRPPKDV